MTIYAWYDNDNECGYSKRMSELCHIVVAKYILRVWSRSSSMRFDLLMNDRPVLQ